MCKQNVVYACNEILFSLKRNEILIHGTTWMNLEDMLNEKNEPNVKGQVVYDSSSISHLE